MRTLAPGVHEEDAFYPIRSEGIRNLRKRRPWSGPLDGLLFLEGLEAAASYQFCTYRTPERPALACDSPGDQMLGRSNEFGNTPNVVG